MNLQDNKFFINQAFLWNIFCYISFNSFFQGGQQKQQTQPSKPRLAPNFSESLKFVNQYIHFSSTVFMIASTSEVNEMQNPFLKQGSNYTLDLNLKPNMLIINLKVSDADQKVQKTYTKVFSESNLPETLTFLNVGVNELFELCQEKCQVDTQRGTLIIMQQLWMKSKSLTKKIQLQLDIQPTESKENIPQKQEQLAKQNSEGKQPLLEDFGDYISLRNIIPSEDHQIQQVKQLIVHQSNTPKSLQPTPKIIIRKHDVSKEEQVQKSEQKKEKLESEVFSFGKVDDEQAEMMVIDMDEIMENEVINTEGSRLAKKTGKFGKRKVKIYQKPGSENFGLTKPNVISYIKEFDRKARQVVIDYKLDHSKPHFRHFIIKVLKYEVAMSIGVIDQNHKEFKISQSAILYHGRSTRVTEQKHEQKQGNGFKQGDQIRVHIYAGKIRWFVNGNQQAIYQHPNLKKQKLLFYPIIQMHSKGDEILWLT